MKDRYLTVQQVADMLHISYETALSLVKYKTESVKVGRQYRVLESKLNETLYPPRQVRTKLSRRPIYQIIERV